MDHCDEINLLDEEEMDFLVNGLGESGHLLDKVDSRFGLPLSGEEVQQLNASIQSKNTSKRNKWALRIFQKWYEVRHPDLSRHIRDFSDEELNEYLSRFIHEVRRVDGERYPNTTLVSILAGLSACVLGDSGRSLFRDANFTPLIKSLDASMKLSTRCGTGLYKQSADFISLEEEELLWTHGQLGTQNPTQLRNTLFYLNGMHFGLRGGEEQANLMISQFRVEICDGKKSLRYVDITTKTYAGGIKQQRVLPKDVRHFENRECPDRCHVRIFEMFLTKRPPSAERFYLQSAAKWKDSICWYTNRPVGKNQLSSVVKTMCAEVGIQGNKTNHSLKATCATRLFQANVDEQLIMQRTGHRSTAGVRAYKRTSNVQIENCSSILDGGNLQQVAAIGRGSIPSSQGVSYNFVFKDCSVTIMNGKSA